MKQNRNPWEGDAPENAQYPKNDNGENFIFWLAAAPFRAATFVINSPHGALVPLKSVEWTMTSPGRKLSMTSISRP